MGRSAQKMGVLIQDVITVFDGVGTEVTGLVNGDFTKILHKDGVVSAVAVTVTEIGAGEYKVSFTPDAKATWRLRIEQSSGAGYNKKGWQDTYDVTEDGLPTLADIVAAVWGAILETGFSASRILRIIAAAVAGKSTGGRASLTARNLADTQNQLVGTANEQGDRTPSSYGS